MKNSVIWKNMRRIIISINVAVKNPGSYFLGIEKGYEMHELKRLAEKYKQVCVILGLFGLLLSPFLWPFFLAIILNSLSLAVPVLVVYIIVDFVKKEKEHENKENRGQEYTENIPPNATKNAEGKRTEHETDAQEDDIQKKGEKRAEPVKQKKSDDCAFMDDASYAAYTWYQMEGKERIFRLIRKLEKDEIYSFSISPEGICSVRKEDSFRRVGVLRAFPKHRLQVIAREINKDKIRTSVNGKYLWLSWGRGMRL